MTGGLKMAEVEFGDTELFEQLDGEAAQPVHIRFDQTEDSEVEANSFHGQLARCEETIEQLRAENILYTKAGSPLKEVREHQELRRKLSILSRPSGLSVDDVLDGPLLQILFMNHVISKQYHQEIEDFVADLLQKHEEEERANPEKTTFNIKPQPSSISLEASENSSVNAVKKIKEAFSVVGSVLYFTNFCLDKLGQPLLNENPQLTDGWEVPKYQQVFGQILSLDGQEVQLQVKTKRPKPCCFNCGSEDHQLRDCPKPRDLAHIDMKRKAFRDSCAESGNQNYQQRYHVEEVAERFGKFKPGNISEELQEALGISDRHLPPFIYRMRQLGYPPGWLKDAELENSGLSLYDGKDSSDGEIVEDAMQKRNQVSYDVSKLVSYPGFNTPSVPGVADDWRSFGSIPMQPDHQKEVLANYLCSNFPDPQHNAAQKRTSSRSSSDAKRQKTSGNGQGQPSLDMDIASDGSYCSPSQRFKFQPPLPPGSPYNTPPSLPRGTPPSTPPNFIPPPPPTPTPPPLPKGTPPPTPPSRGSPLLLSRDGFPLQPKVSDSMDEDTLTLEELEEQQRLIWAALENAESTNSESDVHTPLNGNSVSSSPSRVETDSVTEGKNTSQNIKALKNSVLPRESVKQESNENVLVTTEEESFNKDPNVDAPMQEMVVTEPIDNTDEKKMTCVETDVTEEAACVDPSSSNPRIPDRSKFAEGITPFEFENMSESTGIYLRLRDVLKNSPRNQQKNKQGM